MPFLDARELPRGSELVADLVLIGGGMAGVAMARSLAGSGLTVAVLESGGHDLDPQVQDLYAGSGVMRGPGGVERPFDDYLRSSRIRSLGGSGRVWGGKCVPLDPADFAARPWLPATGWPFGRAELQPFYDRASDLMEVPRFPAGWSGEAPDRPALPIGDGRRFFSAPRAFSRISGGADRDAFDRYRTGFADREDVTVWLNANVTQIRLASDRRSIQRLDVACLNGKRHTAQARAYVLAAGGIENARLLLASNSVDPAGVGNGADLVGRFFQGHVLYAVDAAAQGRATSVYLTRNSPMGLYADQPRDKPHCVIASTLEGQRRMRAGTFTVTLRRAAATPGDRELASIQQIARQLDRGAPVADQTGQLACYFMSENLPNPQSRITLGPTSDALGMPRSRLEWTWTDADWNALEASVNGFAREMGALGLGRVAFPAARPDFLKLAQSSNHHMGTTRMHADPAQGVVDPDGKVHGVSNLYVAGSSVFPTSGIANPTLTLLALTLRLSDHLKTTLRRAA